MTEPWFTQPILIKKDFPDSYLKDNRRFQSIPTIEITPKGRLFAAWQIGGDREPHEDNCCVVSISDDSGKTWLDPYMIIDHEICEVRLCNPVFWLDPFGRMWLFWSQSNAGDTEKMGVWASVCKDPGAPIDTLEWTSPHRYSDYIIINKPIVTKDKRWLYTAQDFRDRRIRHTYCSTDNGESFFLLGSAVAERGGCAETMLLECGNVLHQYSRVDGRINYGMEHAISRDGGESWTRFRRDIDYPFVGPGSRFYIRRLQNGNILFINNDHTERRMNMTAHLSLDDGKTWHSLLLDERMSISYPDACQDADGVIRVIYDRGRSTDKEIIMATFTEDDVLRVNSAKIELISKSEG